MTDSITEFPSGAVPLPYVGPWEDAPWPPIYHGSLCWELAPGASAKRSWACCRFKGHTGRHALYLENEVRAVWSSQLHGVQDGVRVGP